LEEEAASERAVLAEAKKQKLALLEADKAVRDEVPLHMTRFAEELLPAKTRSSSMKY